ncbi:MAG TPA: cyclic nucleotide-binding domain-containing protein [Ilumatobacter sp.]|nr:cyclic nucleotide-binding domain-containing protein [Ilumatobacter sp.]
MIVDLERTLHSGGFLTDPYVDVDAAVRRALAPTGPQAGLEKFARTLTIHWSGAEKLTRWCYRHGLRYLFRPAGIAISSLVAISGIAAFVAVATTQGLSYDAQSLGAAVALLFALNLVLIFIHELGHAAVLVHHKRRVRSAGFRIYFGTPAFFVDSSDALMLDRKARIAQSFGGPYFELVASGVAAIALWMWPHGVLAPTLHSFVFINYYVVLINLTPMLELDGYFMLSDAIRVPDLRPRSLAFVRHDLWAKLRHRERFSAAEVGLLLFGTVGVAFTIFVLVSAFWFWQHTFGGLLESLWNAGPAGVFALVVLVAFLAAPILRGVFALARAVARQVATWVRHARIRSQRRWRTQAAELLDGLPLFDDLPVDVLSDVAGRVERLQVGAGTAVVRQGDVADAFYVVRKGTLEVVEEDVDGTERVVQTLRAGLAALRALTPFANLPSSELLRLQERGTWQNVPPGAAVVEQGEVGDAFFAVADGKFEVVVDGRHVGSCEVGGHFGELALLVDAPRAATVRSLTPARVFRLERSGFERLLADTFRGGADGASHRVAFQRE